METTQDFGELLIEALEDAVAYKQGKLSGVRVTRHEITGGDAEGLERLPKGKARRDPIKILRSRAGFVVMTVTRGAPSG